MPLPFRNTVRELGINKYQSTFIIPSATRADLGVYKCYVNNTYGFQVITRDIRETSEFVFFLSFFSIFVFTIQPDIHSQKKNEKS